VPIAHEVQSGIKAFANFRVLSAPIGFECRSPPTVRPRRWRCIDDDRFGAGETRKELASGLALPDVPLTKTLK
jgi:hypothetical protein